MFASFECWKGAVRSATRLIRWKSVNSKHILVEILLHFGNTFVRFTDHGVNAESDHIGTAITSAPEVFTRVTDLLRASGST